MKNSQTIGSIAKFMLLVGAVAVLLTACATQKGASEPHVKVSGAQLWANNCARCHNFRSPASYSDAQWDVAMAHMKLRANLTQEDSEAILAFLKAAN